MNKYILLVQLLVAGIFPAAAQPCKVDFLGTKTLYQAPQQAMASTPAGYEPVFINYVGRHGARHLTKKPESEYIYKLIQQADSNRALTVKGEQLKKMVDALQQVEKGNTKSISAEGKLELQGIAQRLYKNNKPVFAGQPEIKIDITKEIRTRQSAYAFVQGLQQHLENAKILPLSINDTTLRFYDLSPAYTKFEKQGSWLTSMEALQQSVHLKQINQQVTSRFFTADFLNHLTADEQVNFTSDLLGFATIVYSLSAEIKRAGYSAEDLNFRSLFSCDELNALSKVDEAEDYLKKGPGTDASGIQVKIAAPLLVDFIKSTDAYINGAPAKIYLRFAHAETISPFATLLSLEPATYASKNPMDFQEHWRASSIIPLSANIAWVIYKNKAGDYFIKFLLNENPVKIAGLKPANGYLYRWADVRSFYTRRLQLIGAGLQMNGLQYLSTLQ